MDISLISRKLARLGWADATVAEAKDLSLGSQSLQEQVLHVLAKPHTIPAGFLNADPDVQFLYALRAGERPLTLRGWKYGNDPHILAEVLAGRGAKFVGKYLKYLGFYEDTAFSLTSTNMREIAIILVYSNPTLNFPIPQVPGYLSLWVKVAAHVLAGVERIEAPKNLPLPTREELIDRIDDHVAAALEAGLALWGPLGYLLVFLTRDSRFDRAQLISRVCESFAVAKWKQERQVLAEFLNEDLAVTDLELASNCAAFIPLFEAGDHFIMRTFGGRIIPLLDNSELVSAATTMLHTANTKCQRQILHGLAHREAPPKLESLEDVVVGLTQSSDAKVAKAACDLVQTWGIQDEQCGGDLSWDDPVAMGQKLVALGWKDATVEQALELPLGSEFFRQKVTSIMFFRDELPSGFLSDDPNVLVIYGIRAGMTLSTIPFFKYTGSPTVLAHAVSRRGVSYMQRFISDVRFGGSEFSLPLSNVGVATIMLASDPELGLKIPCSQLYLHGWVAVAAKVFANLDVIENPSGLTLPTREQLMPRLHQHLAVALAEGIPLWGALGFFLIHLSREGLFDRAKLIGLFLSSIECAPRVSLRHRLVTVFTDNLMVTNAELFEHRHVLIPHLVAGELFFVKSFGGWLLPLLDGLELAAVATGALGVKNDGRKREILQILLELKPPTEMTGELTACVRSLANSPNGDVAECAKKLKYMWGIPDDPDCTQPPAS